MRLVQKIILISLLMFSFTQAQVPDETEFEYLSPQKARNYSLFLTLGSIGLGSVLIAADSDGGAGGFGALTLWLGSIFSPGAGHAYAHHSWRFWRGTLIRFAGTGLIITAIAISWDDPDISGGWELFIGGTAILVGSAIYDIATAPNSAREYNEKLEQSRLSLKPCYFPQSNAPGLMLSIQF